MGSRSRTLQEYCEILGVSPSSDEEELKLAWVLRKHDARTGGEVTEADLKEAYQALTDPAKRGTLKSRPGAGGALRARRAPAQRTSVNAMAMLGWLLLALVAVLSLYIWPTYRHQFRTFSAQDRLVEEKTGKPYGTILEVSQSYTFSNGMSGKAYRVKLEPEGREVWLPVSDVKYLCVRQ